MVKRRQEDTYELDDGWVRNREHLVFFMCTPALASISSQPASQQTSKPPVLKAASKKSMQPESGEFQPISS